MKTKIVILVTFWLAVICAGAQQRLWTWKPKNQAALHALHGMAMHESGAAVFVVSEFESTKSEVKFLIVWVNKSGKVLMTRKVSAGGYEKAEDAINWFSPAQFTLSFLGGEAISVVPPDGNGVLTKTRIYKISGGGAPRLTLVDPATALFFGASVFSGWVEKQSKWTTVSGGSGDQFERIESLTAWKL